LARWHEKYGSLGLKIVTVYRSPPTAERSLEEMSLLVKERGTYHPVLLDPKDELLRALEPGPIGYPVAYLVGRDGLVVWEHATTSPDFAKHAEEAIEAELARR
jgi:hypothetical protein